jgi:hypothetical protein
MKSAAAAKRWVFVASNVARHQRHTTHHIADRARLGGEIGEDVLHALHLNWYAACAGNVSVRAIEILAGIV